jgi:outer membrane protein with beta-barrel domain
MTMLRTILLIFLTLCGISTSLYSQIIKGEAVLGLNLTQVEGDEVNGFRKPGVNIGVGAMVPFKNNWDVSMEVNFNQKGARQKKQYTDSLSSGQVITGEYKLRLNYVEVPVLLHYTDKKFITVGAGLSWGRLVGVQEWEHGKRVESTTLANGTYDKNDFSYVIDLRIKITGPLKFGFRYQNSITKIRTREFSDITGNTWTRDQYNKVLTFRLVYMFNEEQSKRNRNATGQ